MAPIRVRATMPGRYVNLRERPVGEVFEVAEERHVGRWMERVDPSTPLTDPDVLKAAAQEPSGAQPFVRPEWWPANVPYNGELAPDTLHGLSAVDDRRGRTWASEEKPPEPAPKVVPDPVTTEVPPVATAVTPPAEPPPPPVTVPKTRKVRGRK